MPGTPGGPIGMRPRPLPRIPMPPRPGNERKRFMVPVITAETVT